MESNTIELTNYPNELFDPSTCFSPSNQVKSSFLGSISVSRQLELVLIIVETS